MEIDIESLIHFIQKPRLIKEHLAVYIQMILILDIKQVTMKVRKIFKLFCQKLAKDPKTGKVIEKIQIYTHSRGAAFGAGYVSSLLEQIKANAHLFDNPDNVIDFVLNMAPHQSNQIKEPNGVDGFSIDHTWDLLSGNDMKGLTAAFKTNSGAVALG